MSYENTVAWLFIGVGAAAVAAHVLTRKENPLPVREDASRRAAESRAQGKIVTLVKGTHVQFEMEGGRIWKLPSSYGMIHDPTGTLLPKCNVYVGPVGRTGRPHEATALAQDYFGSSYTTKIARINVPRSGWRDAGKIVQIFYKRDGRHRGLYFHPTKMPVRISRSGSFCRLDFPSGCVVNYRGFVYP